MKRKIILTLIFCCLIVSCGKKGDPVFKDPKKKAAIKSIYFYKV
tara:strand:- start:525 stop:656 length:132 start_codon:yes stop_codon:yes gene_type:complete